MNSIEKVTLSPLVTIRGVRHCEGCLLARWTTGQPVENCRVPGCGDEDRSTCPECGYEDERGGFEGYEGQPFEWAVRCPKCEALHPDQTKHEEGDEQ